MTFPVKWRAIQLTTQSQATAVVSIDSHNGQGTEGFTLLGAPSFGIVADTASGAFYGAFRFLSFLQQHKPIPAGNFTSSPAMALRAWDLWDTVSGSVEQGHAGNYLLWPYAIYNDENPPPRNQVFLASACNSSDPFQQWEGISQKATVVRNVGSIGTFQCTLDLQYHQQNVGFVWIGVSRTW